MEKTSVILLTVPDSLKSEAFEADPSILLPAECEPGEKTLDPEKLSWETILSGMLRVISVKSQNDPFLTAEGRGKNNPSKKAGFKHGDIIPEAEMNRIPPEWVDYYRRFVLAVKPEIYHEFTGASIVKAQNGDYDMALEINAILEGLFPGSPGVLLNKALILENKAEALGKNGHETESANSKAMEAYERALSMEPVLPDTFFNAGFFFLGLREYGKARDCFSSYVSAGEKSEISAEFQEETSADAHDPAYAEKIKQAKKIIKEINNQGLDDTHYREACDCIDRGDDEEGLKKIRVFIEKHPMVWNGWFILGWALRKLGRYQDGLDAFNKATELGGTSSDVTNEAAICLMELGDLKGARKKLVEALHEEPENTKIISNLGVLAMKTGNKEEAAAFFRTVLELDPDDPLAKHFLEKK